MIRTDIAQKILNGIFSLREEEETPEIQFDHTHLYLGLLTKMPQANGNPYDPSGDYHYFTEPVDDPYYIRVKLDPFTEDGQNNYVNLINNKNYLSDPTIADNPISIETGTRTAQYQPVIVQNQGLILFQEPAEGIEYTIEGFGLFGEDILRDEDGTIQPNYNKLGAPLIWGIVKDDAGNAGVTVAHGSIPIIRENSFTITMI